MIVNSAPPASDLRSERIPAAAPVTYVSMADLFYSDDARTGDRQALIALLQQSGKLTARVVETRADGLSVLEFGVTRAALRLAGTHALGEILTVRLEDAHDATPSARVSLSRPATLLHDIEKNKQNQILTENSALEPLVDAKTEPRQLAAALKQAVHGSGLFYESHLRGWLDGNVALNDIRNEPQARMMQEAAHHAGDAGELLPPRLEYLVRQQLDVLARGAIEWHGLVWPDQPAAIAITAEQPAPEAEAEAERTWRVKLELAVPALGKVAADLELSGDQLKLRLRGDADALPHLKQARGELAATLAAHRLAVAPIQVTRGE